MFYNRLYNRLCTIIYNLTNLEGSLPRLEHVGNMLEHLCSIASVEVQNGANANEIYLTRGTRFETLFLPSFFSSETS